ncbi:MAG: ArnT family glycosyltransferase [Chloroflexota bacterium]
MRALSIMWSREVRRLALPVPRLAWPGSLEAKSPACVPAATARRFWRDEATVFAAAFGIRSLFALATSGSYDPDEFVFLALSRAYVHGAAPYHDFMFFHPPGALVFFGALQPLISVWWPAGRGAMIIIDSITAVIVWRIGCMVFGRRQGAAAGIIYALSPIALLASVRIGQDPIITFLGIAGVLILLSFPSRSSAILAGLCVGVALWFKYPALLFLPVYFLVSPRRFALVLAAAIAGFAALMMPFAGHWHQLYDQSIYWQFVQRGHNGVGARALAVVAFWLLLNPLAAFALLRSPSRRPAWLTLGFSTGALFVLASQIYYHYFVPIVPFAALLGAPILVTLFGRFARLTVGVAVAGFVIWAAALNVAGTRSGLGSLSLADTSTTVKVLDRVTAPGDPVLSDQFEYAYLAHRHSGARLLGYASCDKRGISGAIPFPYRGHCQHRWQSYLPCRVSPEPHAAGLPACFSGPGDDLAAEG